jgi:hypothetical protein
MSKWPANAVRSDASRQVGVIDRRFVFFTHMKPPINLNTKMASSDWLSAHMMLNIASSK